MIAGEVIDRPPATEVERLERLEVLREQVQAAHDGDPIACACGRLIPPPWVLAYRCLFCDLVFCPACARRHFGEQSQRGAA